jgi:hypothetical protein
MKRFVEKLPLERDPDMRVSLKKLLAEKEDKFRRGTERVRSIERYIPKVVVELHHRNALLKDSKPTAATFGWLEEILTTWLKFKEYSNNTIINTHDRCKVVAGS